MRSGWLALAVVLGIAGCQSDVPDEPAPPPAPHPVPKPTPSPKPAAGAPTTYFAPGALIIPTSASFQDKCGAVSVFGLVYDVLRAEAWLQANGYGAITIHYLYRSGKASPNRCKPTSADTAPAPSTSTTWSDGCDFSLAGSGPVVKQVTNASASSIAADTIFTTLSTTSRTDVWPTYGARAIDGTVTSLGFLGGPFAIQAGAPATVFRRLLSGALVAHDSEGNAIDFTPFRPTGTCSFGSTHHVNVLSAQVGFTAEDNLDFSSAPPRVALLDTNNAGYTNTVYSGILQKYLVNAGLSFTGAQGCPVGGNNISSKTACPLGSTSGQIFDLFDFADFTNNLVNAKDASGNPRYSAVWAPHWDSTSTSTKLPTANEVQAVNNVSSFLEKQTGLAAECASISGFEGTYQNGSVAEQTTSQWLTCKNNGTGNCATGTAQEGIDRNTTGTPYNTLKNCSDPDEATGNSCAFYSYPGDSFVQTGDYLWIASSGAVQSFVPTTKTSSIYRPLVRPLISGVASLDKTKIGDPTSARSIIINDFTAYGYKDSDTTKGQIHYMSGHDLSADVSGNLFILETLLQLGGRVLDPPPVATQVTRSSPVITTVASVSSTPIMIQGTLELVEPPIPFASVRVDADAAAFTYPPSKGHMYGLALGTISTTAQAFNNMIGLFDVATFVPPGNYSGCGSHFAQGCRTIFTTTGSGRFPAGGGGSAASASYTFIQSSTRAALATQLQAATTLGGAASLTTASLDKVLTAVVTAPLGGVDWSTAAVIPPSPVVTSVGGANGGTRPTMIYFGATDGMLHAACAEAVAGTECDIPGRELWAYLPRTQQPFVRWGAAAIEGSPHVVDSFGDWYGTGTPSWKTILTFHTGTGNIPSSASPTLFAGQTPAVIAIDVTDPSVPRVLWEYTVPTPATPRAYELGQGMSLAMGYVAQTNGTLRAMTFAQGNNAGTGGAADVVVALDTVTGSEVWTTPFGFPYTAGAHGDSPPVPATGVPGGVVGIDKRQNGSFSDLVFGDLYGQVWMLDPATGLGRFGATTPLFVPSVLGRPIGAAAAIYSNGAHMFAAFGTGGYADFTDSATWTTGQQKAFSVMLDSSAGNLNENSTSQTNGQNNLGFVQNITGNDYAQITVVGAALYLDTDNSDVNSSTYGTHGNTGLASQLTLGAAGNVSAVVALGAAVGGAGSLGAATNTAGANTIYASTSSGALDFIVTTAAGNQVNYDSSAKVSRLLFLRTK
jgi:hypothetical protein|nr:hypothetical protein [Kofleriaceae bacterium]